jgi:hypothetical protein
MITTDRWQTIKELFHASLEREPDQRPSFLDDACRGDDSLRREVELLVAANEKDGSFIDSPAYEVAAHLLMPVAARSTSGRSRSKAGLPSN